MKALILAAGRGSRLAEHTADQPKCLTRVWGRTLIDWTLGTLREAGVTDITLVTGYKSETLSDIPNTHTLQNSQWASTNMVSSLLCAQSLLESDACLVSYSDILYSAESVRTILSSDLRSDDLFLPYNTAWQESWSERFADPLTDAETFQLSEGYVTHIGGRPKSVAEVQGQFMGLLFFSPRVWIRIRDYLNTLSEETIAKLDVTSLLNRLIQTGIRVRGIPLAGDWLEIDSVSDLAVYQAKPKPSFLAGSTR